MSWPNNILDTELALEITLILEYDKKLWMLDYHARRDIDKIIAAIWSISLPAVHSAVFASSSITSRVLWLWSMPQQYHRYNYNLRVITNIKVDLLLVTTYQQSQPSLCVQQAVKCPTREQSHLFVVQVSFQDVGVEQAKLILSPRVPDWVGSESDQLSALQPLLSPAHQERGGTSV